MIELSTMIGVAKVAKTKKPFYAAELGLSGSTMSALYSMGVVKKTGKTKEAFFNLYDDVYKRVEVNQWRSDVSEWDIDKLRKQVEEARKFIACFEELGL